MGHELSDGLSELTASKRKQCVTFELLYESWWKCLKPPGFLGVEGCCCGRSAETGLVGAASETHSLLIQHVSGMCSLWGNFWVHPRTESPFMGAVKDAHCGECFCTLWHLLRLEECGSLVGGGCEHRATFTPLGAEWPHSPWPQSTVVNHPVMTKAFKRNWERLLLLSVGKCLNDQKLPHTEPYSRNSLVSTYFVFYCMLGPPLSWVLWIEAYLYNMNSNIQTIIFSLKTWIPSI